MPLFVANHRSEPPAVLINAFAHPIDEIAARAARWEIVLDYPAFSVGPEYLADSSSVVQEASPCDNGSRPMCPSTC